VSEDLRFWKGDKATRHSRVAGHVKAMQDRNGYRRGLDLHHLRLYSDKQVTGLTGASYARAAGATMERKPRLSLNVVRSCIDSATSLITKARPRASFLTTAGDFDAQQRAKKRERFVSALWHANNAYSLGQRAFKDAAIFGTGIVKVCREHGKVRLEKTFPGELLVDDTEAIYGDPRTLFQVRTIDRLVLKELCPGKAREIDEAAAPDARVYGRGHISDMVVVYEAWHLPSGPDSGDGWHGIYTDTATLSEEEYCHDAFPFAFFRWNEDSLGWSSSGIAYELTGIQYEINQLLRAAQVGMYQGSNLKVMVERGSKVIQATLNNDIRGTIVEYTGVPPTFIAPDAVSNQLLAHMQWLVEQAYAITGVSQLGARSEVPGELQGSGRAMLVYQNIESQRFLTVQRQYEKFFMDLSERCLEAASDLYEEDPKLFATYVSERDLERIAFEEIQGDSDEYVVQVFPTSALPNDPAGRFAYIEQLRAGQYIDQRLDRILSKGEYLGPHPRMDLELALKRSTLAYQRAELNGTPPERLELLGQFVDEVNYLIGMAARAGAARAGTAPAGPVLPGTMPNPTPPEMLDPSLMGEGMPMGAEPMVPQMAPTAMVA
jgi:hypothetical protein